MWSRRKALDLDRKRVFDFAAARRLPAIYELDFYARAGGLMSYGADLRERSPRRSRPVLGE